MGGDSKTVILFCILYSFTSSGYAKKEVLRVLWGVEIQLNQIVRGVLIPSASYVHRKGE